MKKFLSLFLTAALILSISACGNNNSDNTEDDDEKSSYSDEKDKDDDEDEDEDKDDEDKDKDEDKNESENNSGLGGLGFGFGSGDKDKDENEDDDIIYITETTEPAPETEATKPAETETTPSAPQGQLIENSFLDGLKDKSPLYYEFGKVTSTIPCTLVMTMVDSDGKETGTAAVSMESLSRIGILSDAEGQKIRMIMDNGTYYMIGDTEKSILYYSLSGDEKASMEEEMANAMKFTASFDFDKAEFSSGIETFMGESLKFETVDDGSTSATLYFDPATGRARYIVSEGQTVRIDDYYTGTDSSLFNIPADYEMTDLSALMAGN